MIRVIQHRWLAKCLVIATGSDGSVFEAVPAYGDRNDLQWDAPMCTSSMRFSLILAVTVWGAGTCVFPLSKLTRAEESTAATDGKVVELFDGKTLKNWKVPEFGGDGKVTVMDGQLIIGRGEPISGVTWAGEPLPTADYELSFEAQRVDGSDFFGTITFPVQKSHCSFVLGGWGGGVTGLSSLDGYDASENQTTNYQQFEMGKWYQVRVRVTQMKIEVWLDQEQVVDVDYSDKKVGTRIEVELSKPLGFSTFRTTGAIRHIKLTHLKPVQASK